MKAIVFTETRPIARIPEIVEGHLEFLPDDFELIVNCSEANKANFYGLPVKKFNIVSINSLHDYNVMMTNKNLWLSLIEYERILIAQVDSMLLRHGIEEFYKWDYIGAPWLFQDHGGNGGLSLRNPQSMYDISKNDPYHPSAGYEDVYFCNRMRGHKLAPRNICEKFSTETIFKLGTLGYHAIDNYLPNSKAHEIKNQYK